MLTRNISQRVVFTFFLCVDWKKMGGIYCVWKWNFTNIHYQTMMMLHHVMSCIECQVTFRHVTSRHVKLFHFTSYLFVWTARHQGTCPHQTSNIKLQISNLTHPIPYLSGLPGAEAYLSTSSLSGDRVLLLFSSRTCI